MSWVWQSIGAGGVLAVISGCALVLLARRQPDSTAPETPSPPAGQLLPPTGSDIQVHTAEQLISGLQLQGLWESIRQRSGFAAASFARDCTPLLHAVADLCQLLPASESHHHAQPGGLLIHLFEVLNHALGIRTSYTLPRGVPPEDIHKLQHLWTYGIFVGALLHDIGKPMADLQITARAGHRSWPWHPLSGSLGEGGAQTYRVAFQADRDYTRHQKLPVILAQRLIPQPTLQWLSSDPVLLQELMAYLGDEHDEKSLIAEIVTKADRESVAHNLRSGSRARFASARIVPLVERLMHELCALLEEGGRLPLNRPGAVGWIYRGEAWFVCKRLVEELRQAFAAKGEGKGIPGPDRDERIYDTFQEYGAVITNPLTHGAIWHIRIELETWSADMRVLRFPLEKLYRDPSQYPSAIAGQIVILDPGATMPTLNPNPVETASGTSPSKPVAAAARRAEPGPGSLAAVAMDESNVSMAGAPAPPALEPESMPAINQPDAAPVPHVSSHDAAPTAAQSIDDPTPETLSAEDFLDDIESASALQAEVRQQRAADNGAGRPAPMARMPPAEILPPVVPATPALPPLTPRDEAPPPPLALQFMRWLQEGIAQGSLLVNTSQAQVHSVKEGLLLVTPRIFRQFTHDTDPRAESGEALEYTAVQKAVFKAHWHYIATKPAPKGRKATRINILRYTTSGGGPGGATTAKPLSGVVIQQPERFVNPVPPVNCHLTYREDITLNLGPSS